jgi:hypothetical protein
MPITAAHEGVVASPPKQQLWVVNPDADQSNGEWSVGAIRKRLATHTRTVGLIVVGGTVAGAAIGVAIALLIRDNTPETYIVPGIAFLAVIGAYGAFRLASDFSPAPLALDKAFTCEQVRPLYPLTVYGVGVTDTTRWDALWILACNFWALFQAEIELEEMLERAADIPVPPGEATRRTEFIDGLRSRALDHASSVWVSVAEPRGLFLGVDDGL